jgi:hypothetical protein
LRAHRTATAGEARMAKQLRRGMLLTGTDDTNATLGEIE